MEMALNSNTPGALESAVDRGHYGLEETKLSLVIKLWLPLCDLETNSFYLLFSDLSNKKDTALWLTGLLRLHGVSTVCAGFRTPGPIASTQNSGHRWATHTASKCSFPPQSVTTPS